MLNVGRVLSRQQLRTILDGLSIVPGREGDLAVAVEVARRGRATALVRGTFVRLGDRVRVDVQILEGASGRLLAAESALAERPEEILSHVDLLAMKLLLHLGARPQGEAARQTLRDVRTESLDAYRYYSLGLEKAHSLHTREAIALFEKASAGPRPRSRGPASAMRSASPATKANRRGRTSKERSRAGAAFRPRTAWS
jgi:hypothetical protein